MKDKEDLKNSFRELMTKSLDEFNGAVSTDRGEWIVKGFIDVFKNIYTISVDTKVISKIMEILLFPKISEFAIKHEMKLILSKEQNHYPDITFIDKDNNKFAIDLKSSYRKNSSNINGMTLGAFTGYFRNRSSGKNITFPYQDYVGHFVLGLIYSRSENEVNERKCHSMAELQEIGSVVNTFEFFIQEKYRIATDRPGSGNTKNIGSITKISDLINGNGPFKKLGEQVFDDYWMYYLTKDMAKGAELAKAPYRNLTEYVAYKKLS